MKILVLGGDGFCGWPTSLHLSARGHDVTIVDNLSRRNIDNELEVASLTPIQPLGVRLAAWRTASNPDLAFHNIEVEHNNDRLRALLRLGRGQRSGRVCTTVQPSEGGASSKHKN